MCLNLTPTSKSITFPKDPKQKLKKALSVDRHLNPVGAYNKLHDSNPYVLAFGKQTTRYS